MSSSTRFAGQKPTAAIACSSRSSTMRSSSATASRWSDRAARCRFGRASLSLAALQLAQKLVSTDLLAAIAFGDGRQKSRLELRVDMEPAFVIVRDQRHVCTLGELAFIDDLAMHDFPGSNSH